MSIIIPVFNEQEGLEKTIQEMNGLLEKPEYELEVIFINDGSTDKSGKILQGLAGRSYKVLHHERNRGYGAALKSGISSASSEHICITDADGTYPNSDIFKLADMLTDDYSMVVGARTGDVVKDSFLRRFPKWFLKKLASYLTGIDIPDLNSGLRVMKKDVVEKYLNILPDGFSFTTTITLAMITNGYRVQFVPVNYRVRRGRSKIRPIRDTLVFIQLIIRTVMYFEPLKVFLPVSLILFAAAIAALIHRILVGKGLLVVSVILFMAAIQVLVVGMLADLINKKASIK